MTMNIEVVTLSTPWLGRDCISKTRNDAISYQELECFLKRVVTDNEYHKIRSDIIPNLLPTQVLLIYKDHAQKLYKV